jgi:hypothetical protein
MSPSYTTTGTVRRRTLGPNMCSLAAMGQLSRAHGPDLKSIAYLGTASKLIIEGEHRFGLSPKTISPTNDMLKTSQVLALV